MSLADLGRTYHGGAPGPEPSAPAYPLLPLGRDLPGKQRPGLVDGAEIQPVGVGVDEGQAAVVVLHESAELAGVDGQEGEQEREDRHRDSRLSRQRRRPL